MSSSNFYNIFKFSFFFSNGLNEFKTCGSRVSVIIFTNEICMAVGNESLRGLSKLQ